MALARTALSRLAQRTAVSSKACTRALSSLRYDISSKELISMEEKYAAHNYHPIPAVFARADGMYVWDPEGKQYYDFLSAYGAVNQGHNHPKIMKAMKDQLDRYCLSSRAFHNDIFPQYAKYITEYFGYDMVLPMNTGAEGVETAIKIARRWGYDRKGIPENEAIVLTCSSNFHGRTMGIVSFSTDPDARRGFGPYLPGFRTIEYGDIADLEKTLEEVGDRVAAVLMEPIQGEAGIVVPPEGYIPRAKELCEKHNVLLISDEIQSGLCRSGKMLAIDWENIRPDMVILGKALSGGVYPVSAVLADEDVMSVIRPGEHGSTYGGNAVGCAVAIAALEVLKEENMAENADKLGTRFRQAMKDLDSPLITEIRGRGLFNAIVIGGEAAGDKTAWDVTIALKQRGLLAKPTHDDIIRFTPPLCMTEEQGEECIQIIAETLEFVHKADKAALPKE